jgi:hypothetical protein
VIFFLGATETLVRKVLIGLGPFVWEEALDDVTNGSPGGGIRNLFILFKYCSCSRDLQRVLTLSSGPG